MAVRYNRHRQKVDFSRHFDYKRQCSPQDSPERVSVKYVNKRCSPEHIHKSNSPSPDQNTITITVKKKNIQQRKPAERVKTAPSLITINDYLKVLAKKCSTPDIHQPYVLSQKKTRCSDTCVNTSTPFRTKTIVNTVSLDPKRVPADCKNLLNHPLMQAQLSIYRCQLKTEKDNVCRTCNSTAIFEVVKCLYDCYKKKKCDPCKCVVCGYLPKDIRKLINEVGRSSVSIGVETPTTNRVTRSTMTSQEDELLSMIQSEQKQEKQPQLSASEKLRIAKAFGILTPPVDVDREPYCKEKNTDYATTTDAPCLDDDTELEKWLYRTNVTDASPSIRVPSKKLRKARASGLLTPLDGKTQEQREKMLRHLAMNDIPLPEGKTESEKRVITKVRRELGLPPGPTTFAEKERYAKAQAAGIITPLKGKSQPQKENILRTLLENGIPLPEGRTALEKALIEKIELDCLMKPMAKSDTEKTIKSKARSYVHTLFNKFANETGYMVLVETSCVKDRFHNLQLLTPLEGEAHHIWPKETKSFKSLFKDIEIGGRLIPKSQGKIQIEKESRRTEKECREQRDGQIYSKKSNKRQLNSGALLEEIIAKSKETRLAVVRNPLSRSRTSLENLFEGKVKDKARASNVVIGRTHKAKGSKSESEQIKVVKGLAEARLSLTHDYVPPDKEYIYKFRDKPTVLEKKTFKSNETGNADPQKINRGMVTKLISKLVSHIQEIDNNGARPAIRERDVTYKIKKPSFRNSYLTINLSVSDASDETRKETRSVTTDTKDIKYTSDIATSVPSIPNSDSTEADEAEAPDKIPTKEIKKRDKRNANTNEDTSNSVFYFHFDSDDTDETANQSDNNEKDYEENADLFYIYKPNFDVNAKGMITTSSRIILTDPYNISPTTSGSLYLIETGSTDSYDSTVTDFSYATKETSETETGTDVFYLQQSDDEVSKDTGSEPRIYWFYRNRVVHDDSTGKDAKIYLVSEIKMQQRYEPLQRTKRLDLYRRCNNFHSSRNQHEVMEAGPKVLRRTSSVFIVISPSGNDEFSPEEVGSLIYVEKLDSISKLKNIKFVRHENTQKFKPIKMYRRHTRNEEKVIKHCIDSRILKCPENSRRTERASHKLPIANAFTNHPYDATARENKLEYSKQYHKQRIPPEHSDNQSMTAGRVTWERELTFKLSSCSTTCRLGLNRPERRIECSGKQRMEPKRFEMRDKDGPACGKYPPYKTYTRYIYSSKRTSYQEKEMKCNPDHRLVTKNSKVCLISTAHSSRYRVGSKVSFSDELKYIVQGKLSGPCKEKCIDPESAMKDPPVKPKECRVSYDSSSCCSSDEKEKRRARKPQFKIKISPKTSNSNLKSDWSTRGSKVHFDSTLSSCCPCEKKEPQPPHPCSMKKESKRCGRAKKAPQQSDSDLSNEESKCGDKMKEEAQQDPNSCKKQSRSCDKKGKAKKENKQCKDQQADLKSTKCKTVTIESSEDAKKDSREPESLDQTSDDKQGSLSQERSSQCRETVKRATSPLNVDMKSVGVDSSCSKPNDAEESQTGCREKTTEKPQKVCGGDSDTVKAEDHTCGGTPTDCPDKQTANENLSQVASVPPALNSTRDCLEQPADDICQRQRPQCPASNTRESIMQSTRQSVKEQMLTEQLCPPSATQKLTEQPTDECININQKMASECAELKCENSTTPTNGNDVLNQQMTSECPANSNQNCITQPAEDNAKLNEQTASECPANSAQDSVTQPLDNNAKLNGQTATECPMKCTEGLTNQPSDECAKQQMVKEQYCPPNSTKDPVKPCLSGEQEPAENERKETDICPNSQKKTDDSITQPVGCDANLNQQMASECPANSTQASTTQPVGCDANSSQQTTPECPANSTQDSTTQPRDDNAKLNEQTPECPANSTQDSTTQPRDDNAKLNEQTPECPANSTQDSITQPADNNAKLKEQTASECPTKCTEGQTKQPSDEDPVKPCSGEHQEPAKSEPKETDVCPKSQKKKKDGTPCGGYSYTGKLPPLPAATPDAQSSSDPNQTDQKQLTQQSDSHEKSAKHTCDSKSKKYGRVWWCRKKQVLLRHPDPPSSVEEHTVETQCERDVKDLAQMTDDLLRNVSDLEQCRCGGTVKPCQCLLELAETISSSSSRVTSTKTNSDYKCPQPLLLIRGQNENKLNDLGKFTEQKPNCSCEAFLQKNNLQLCQCKTEQTSQNIIKNEEQAGAPYIYTTNDPCHCPQGQNMSGGASNVNERCACRGPTVTEQTAADGTCPGVKLTSAGKKKVTCECPHPILTRPTPAGKNEAGGTCQGATSGPCAKLIMHEYPRPIPTEQTGAGPCQCMMPGAGGKKNVICECPVPKPIGKAAAGQNDICGTCQGIIPGAGGKKNIICECPVPKPIGKGAAGQNYTCGTCQGIIPGAGGKKNIICECPVPKPAAGQNDTCGTCQGIIPGAGGKKNIICECPVPKPKGKAAAGQNDTCGTCHGIIPGGKKNISCECPGPTTIVKEQTTGIQCQKGAQRSCDDLAKVEPRKGKEKSGAYKKTVICESPSKDKFQLACPGDKKAGQKDQKKRRLSLNLVKRKIGQTGDSSSDDEGQKKSRVKWSQKKYVISECPPLPSEGECGPECTSPEKQKQLKKNAKHQAKIKTGEKKVETSCTHGAAPCLCKDKPICRQKKNHKCECPCPLFVEEVDLNPAKSGPKKKIVCECPVPKPTGRAAAGQNDTCGTCQGIIPGSGGEENIICECPVPKPIGKAAAGQNDTCGTCQGIIPGAGGEENIICECPVPKPIGKAAAGQNDTCGTCQGIILDPPGPPKGKKKESDHAQVTEEKKDKCSYTDRPIKNICKTKNKSSGQGKWGKKKKCVCPPEPPTVERGCDPPCVREQWRMRSQETCSKSGFSVRKKPAPRVDHTMCFEEALAYFEQHPEDDPMRKRKKKKTVICECPPTECGGLRVDLRTAVPYCLSRQ